MKFKKGDIVRIVKLYEDIFSTDAEERVHKRLLGREFEIDEVRDDWEFPYSLRGEMLWNWNEDNLELVK